MLYRVFAWNPHRPPRPLAVPREMQGGGRHDNPDQYTALYLARARVSAIAEQLQDFRGQALDSADLARADGRRLSLAALDDAGLPDYPDLDDPAVLVAIGRRPSQIATGIRPVTQAVALEAFLHGSLGIAWWSTLEASWTNVTLFDVRLPDRSLPVVEVVPLTLSNPHLLEAVDRLGIRLLS